MTRQEMNARIEELEASETELAGALEVAGSEVEALTEKAESLEKARQDAIEQAEKHAAAIADLQAENADQAAQIKELSDERDKAVAKLANPAIADADTPPANADGAVISDAEADELDRQALEETKTEFANIKEEYEAMEPGSERQAFWKANKSAILNCE